MGRLRRCRSGIEDDEPARTRETRAQARPGARGAPAEARRRRQRCTDGPRGEARRHRRRLPGVGYARPRRSRPTPHLGDRDGQGHVGDDDRGDRRQDRARVGAARAPAGVRRRGAGSGEWASARRERRVRDDDDDGERFPPPIIEQNGAVQRTAGWIVAGAGVVGLGPRRGLRALVARPSATTRAATAPATSATPTASACATTPSATATSRPSRPSPAARPWPEVSSSFSRRPGAPSRPSDPPARFARYRTSPSTAVASWFRGASNDAPHPRLAAHVERRGGRLRRLQFDPRQPARRPGPRRQIGCPAQPGRELRADRRRTAGRRRRDVGRLPDRPADVLRVVRVADRSALWLRRSELLAVPLEPQHDGLPGSQVRRDRLRPRLFRLQRRAPPTAARPISRRPRAAAPATRCAESVAPLCAPAARASSAPTAARRPLRSNAEPSASTRRRARANAVAATSSARS